MIKLVFIFILLISILLTIFNPNAIVSFIYFLTNEKILFAEIIISGIVFFIYYQRIMLGFIPSKSQKRNLLTYKKIKNHEIQYYREIPQKGNLNQIFWLAINYQMINNKANLIGAFILKWLNEEKIKINSNNEIILPELFTAVSNNIEDHILVNMLYEIAGNNKILEINELKKWMKTKKNKNRINKYFDEIVQYYNKEAIRNGLIRSKNGEIFETEELRNKALQLAGFKKFLIDYSLIHQRELQEVKLWEDYLVIAHLLGIATQVRNNLKKIYPDIESSLETNYRSIFDYISFNQVILWEVFLFLPISLLGSIIMGGIVVGGINIAFIILSLPARIIVRRFIK